ncbi:MAG: cobalt-zinc-cadmium efflux system outer membrane protein [Candidatus Marinamargulisbacteria bacterium]|jgi:cobalt-zinc-cadmium efflux system outer membrane protein
MKKISCLCGLLILLSGVQVMGESRVIKSAEEAVRFGLENSPEIEMQALLLAGQRELPKKIGSLSDPKIGLRLNGSPSKMSSHSVDQKRVYINQSFPFIGELSRKRKMAESRVLAAEISFLMVRNKVVLEIQQLYFQLIRNRDLHLIAEKNKKILENLISIADIKYRSGKTLQANVLKARVSKSKIDEKILQLKHTKVLLTQELRRAIGISPEDKMDLVLDYPALLTFPSGDQIGRLVSETLAVRHAKAMQKSSAGAVNVEKDRFLPDFSAQLEYWDNSGMANQMGGQVAMTVPWLNTKNAASLKSSEAVRDAGSQNVLGQKNKTRSVLLTLISELETVDATMQLYESHLLKDAMLSLSSFQHAFEVDKASFLDYFEAEKTLFSLDLDFANLQSRSHALRAKLNAQFEKGGRL